MHSIYIDLDDVLCDSAGAYVGLVNSEFGFNYSFEDIHSFDLKKSFRLSDEQNRYMFDLAHRPDFVVNIPVIEGTCQVLEQWRDQGVSVEIVTGRHTDSYGSSLNWLEEKGIRYDSFTMVDKYAWPSTNYELARPLSELLKREYLAGIEDNLTMVEFLKEKMGVPVLLHDRPWNRGYNECASVKRFTNWMQLFDMDLFQKSGNLHFDKCDV